MKISLVTGDIIWHNQRKFCLVLLFHAWMVRAIISKTLFPSEHAIVYRWAYFLSVKILFANTKNKHSLGTKQPGYQSAWLSCLGSMLEKFGHLNHQPKDIQELKSALRKRWDELWQDEICKSITDFRKRLRACVNAEGGHFEHVL